MGAMMEQQSVPREHLRAVDHAPCPSCAPQKRYVTRPPLKKVLKTCPVCDQRFTPRSVRHNRLTQAPIAGFVTCSAACARKLDIDPITGLNANPRAQLCVMCGGVLETKSIIGVCRICAVEKNIRKRLKELARKKRLKRKRRDAIIAYEVANLEIID